MPSLLFPFQSNNENVPRLAKEQFGQELVRYALIYSIAQYDRFVLELAVLDAVMSAAARSNGKIATDDVAAIDQRVRGDSPTSSVAAELRKLAGADNLELSTGLGWFRGLYDVRNCLVHRAGIVSPQDAHLLSGITWRRLSLLLGEQEITALPFVAAEGGEIRVRISDYERAWTLGEPIALGSDELQQMLYSLMQLAAALIRHLNDDFAERFASGAAEPEPMREETVRVKISRDLERQAKSEAAKRRVSIRDLVEGALRVELDIGGDELATDTIS